MQNLLQVLYYLYLYSHNTLGSFKVHSWTCSTIKPSSDENTESVNVYYDLHDCKTEKNAWDNDHLSVMSWNWPLLN